MKNNDKILLLLVLLVCWFSTIGAALHIFHHEPKNMEAVAFISFMTGTVSALLGAFTLMLTGQKTNDLPPSTDSAPNPPKPASNSAALSSGGK